MVSSQNGLDHRRHLLGPWMFSFQNRVDHGRHPAWAMDALFAEWIRPCMPSWSSGHGCSLLTTVKKRVIRPGAEQKRMQAKGALVAHAAKE